ncbi:nucleoside monophosphate kinase [Candidatus Uhrbacteria bacterium]|nr:nucleoside monophosphate kinase [Candidatus Uhrbacteria bacterium]
MTSPKNILLFGPQGSGKGTQGEKLAARLGTPLIGSGTLLREEAKKATERGRYVREELKSGRLVPAEITNAITLDRLREPDTEGGFILDGYPRSIVQESALRDFLLTLRGGTNITHAFVFEFPEEEAIARLSGRRTCSNCQEIYHVVNRPPKKEGVCDKCGGEVMQRTDDTPNAIRQRLAIYHENTEPLLKDYERDGVVVHIDARGTIDEVFARVVEVIEGK